jgi:pSer/pThr/pTyr-binding forkhead associated (FHA) protein
MQLGGVLVARDLDSTNGTYVNGFRISESHLMPGDKLTMGKRTFMVYYESHSRGTGSTAQANTSVG